MDRKNYFYPDLPKAYQISQADSPIAKNGCLEFFVKGESKTVRIERLHIEEDAGKLMHTDMGTRVDYNRCGVPLIEIVSAPELRSAEEASAYLRALRDILVECGVSDCKMQEGALRCDVNLSLRKKGEDALGVRTEIKNINSFSFVEKAITHESERQAKELDAGRSIRRETRRFDSVTGETKLMRVKETEADYRFFPEPDLPPFVIDPATVKRLHASIPELPAARTARFCRDYGISEQDSTVLNADRFLASFFEDAASKTSYTKLLSNLIQTDLLRLRLEGEHFVSPVSAMRLAELCNLQGDGEINSSTAKKLLVRLSKGDFDLCETVARESLAQIRDPEKLRSLISEVMKSNTKAVADYRSGKSAALRSLEGAAMGKVQGRADPVLLETLFLEALDGDPLANV
jgi:aspartyl-tRNA(Asn)/glutamyl-tRNA(Gln) amidotransferase subunit B